MWIQYKLALGNNVTLFFFSSCWIRTYNDAQKPWVDEPNQINSLSLCLSPSLSSSCTLISLQSILSVHA
ncbi:hypothetical protein BCR39DRAFT_522440 [Naematelia encephala]|uniref:Uncharacterized protein n=1 Tax=Naematelia encephala TaxID=71784 RepID=A0A1Y2BDS7_9TREE|nr:hypothetical protein BCR39DRAFT_522440 [Naematelia encephala]